MQGDPANPDILQAVGVLIDEMPDSYLVAGMVTTIIWIFGVVASIALELGWFALLFTLSWPILFTVGAILILCFFSLLRYAKYRQSHLKFYLMVPVVGFCIVLLTIAQIRKEADPHERFG
jgi:MFS family permease